MPDKGFSAQATPNPNSLKVTTRRGPFLESGMQSFGSAEEAAGHPLAAALFEVAGVIDVFVVPAFLTVTKAADRSWESVWPLVEAAIAAHLPD